MIQTEYKGYPKKVRALLLLFQLIFLYLPILSFFSINTELGPIPASVCYFFSLVFAPHLLINIKKLRLPAWYISVFFLFVIVFAFIRAGEYGISKNILHWLFGLYLLVVIVNVGADFDKELWLNILEIAACAFAVIYFIFLCIQYETVFWLLKGYFNGEFAGDYGWFLNSLTSGGRHFDVVWMTLGGFFVRGRKKAVYGTFAIFAVFLAGSRVGLISVILLIIWSLIYDPIFKLSKKKLKFYLLYAVIMLAILFLSGLGQAMLGRFFTGLPSAASIFQSNKEVVPPTDLPDVSAPVAPPIEIYDSTAMMSGRKPMWQKVPEMFKDNIFGYGVGNAMKVMRSDYGSLSPEGILHNVFMQFLLDEGIIGAFWYISMLVLFFYRQRKERFKDPLAAYLLSFIILSLVIFHGGEAIMLFVLGVYLTVNNHCFFVSDLFAKIKRKLGKKTA